jgi:hypothetical protein
MQTLAHRSRARSLGRAACAALLVMPLFGETKTLLRVSRLRSEGWS